MTKEILDRDSGVVLFSGFEGASAGEMRQVGDGCFDVDCLQEERVPEAAFDRVFYDYNFAIGLRNTTDQVQGAQIRLHLCERSAGRNWRFMAGPYWIKEGRGWRRLLSTHHQHGDDWVETSLRLDPHQRTILSTKPFWTARETEAILDEYETKLPFVHKRSLGKTAEGRDLWVIETQPREERIFIHSSFQSAEFAGDVVLHVLDWLGTPTRKSTELLSRFQFTLLPVPMPDGVAHGYSIMNARGRCPMFDFGHASRGEHCAEESLYTWRDLAARPPVLLLAVHVHPGEVMTPKLNPVKAEWFRTPEDGSRSKRVEQAMLARCPEWRMVPVPLDDPAFTMEDSLLVLAAKELGTAAFAFQDYALTPEGAKPFLIGLLDAALGEL